MVSKPQARDNWYSASGPFSTHANNTTDTPEGVQTHSSRSKLNLTVPNSPIVSTPEQTDNARMLDWVKRLYPLQLSNGESVHSIPRSRQRLTSAATEATTSNKGLVDATQQLRPNEVFTPRRTTITAPADATQLQYRPTLAQRRAEKQLAQSQVAVSQSAPNTARLQLASLHKARGSEEPATVIPSQSSSAIASQPGQLHKVSHTQSSTWKRPTHSGLDHYSVHPEIAKWTKVERDLLQMGLIKRAPGKPDCGSFVVPKTFEQWLEFRAGRMDDALEKNAAEIRKRNLEVEVATMFCKIHGLDNAHSSSSRSHKFSKGVKTQPAMGGKNYFDGRGTVLAQASIWSPWYQPTEERPEALWPCPEEMKEEGDERHTSAFGRFPALPRVPGNPTVVWKVKPLILALPFDNVWKLPNKNTWAEVHGQKPYDPEEGHMEELIGQSLLGAINS